jgi:hypothetical protein
MKRKIEELVDGLCEEELSEAIDFLDAVDPTSLLMQPYPNVPTSVNGDPNIPSCASALQKHKPIVNGDPNVPSCASALQKHKPSVNGDPTAEQKQSDSDGDASVQPQAIPPMPWDWDEVGTAGNVGGVGHLDDDMRLRVYTIYSLSIEFDLGFSYGDIALRVRKPDGTIPSRQAVAKICNQIEGRGGYWKIPKGGRGAPVVFGDEQKKNVATAAMNFKKNNARMDTKIFTVDHADLLKRPQKQISVVTAPPDGNTIDKIMSLSTLYRLYKNLCFDSNASEPWAHLPVAKLKFVLEFQRKKD